MGQYYTSKVPLKQRNENTAGRSEILRKQLYKFGKTAGTARSIPGIAGSNFGQRLANARNQAYPIARFLGNYQTFAKKGQRDSGAFLRQGAARGGRILSGMISGRAIDAAIRPFGNFGLGQAGGMLIGRQFRIQLGKQLQGGKNPVDKAIKKMTERVSVKTEAQVNGRAVNYDVRKNKEIARIAQKVLTKAFLNAQAFAPDVSSGQYTVGGKGLKRNTGLLNEDLMLDTENFNKRGIAYRDSGTGNKYYRDVFGFSKPGQARSHLLSSIDMMPVRPTRGNYPAVRSFFRGEISAGGSLGGFPWIWAVEYGGDIPVLYPAKSTGQKRKGRGRRKGSRNALNFDEQGNAIYGDRLNSLSDKEAKKAKRNFNMKYAESDAVVPKNLYIKPTFFLHRSAHKAASVGGKMAHVREISVGSPSSKYYEAWLRNAKSKQYKNQGIQTMGAKSLPYSKAKATMARVAFRERYKQDRGPGAGGISNMELAIPGPRVDIAHGGFYSKELQDAIGIKYAPEDFTFSFSFPTKETDSPRVLKVALDNYIRSGGFSTSYNQKETIESIANAIGNIPGKTNESKDALRKDALRYASLFKNYEKAQGNSMSLGQKNNRAQYLDKVFNLSIKKTPGNRRANVSLRKKHGTVLSQKKAKTAAQKKANEKKKQLGEEIFSNLDLRTILDEMGG